MYQDHPDLEKPINENIKIWKYLDFTKFFSLIERQALFFPRADKLPDPFEGSYTKINKMLRPLVYKKKGIPENIIEKMSNIYEKFRKFFFINCWSISEHESFAMWKLFLKSDEGVAIQSTYKLLRESFNKTEETVHIGKVKYIDYNAEIIKEGNILFPFFHKRKSFEYEQELRALIMKHASRKDNPQELDLDYDFGPGIHVSIDLNILIQCIYVAPTSTKWFKELVSSVVSKYNLEKEVKQSSLEDGPVY